MRITPYAALLLLWLNACGSRKAPGEAPAAGRADSTATHASGDTTAPVSGCYGRVMGRDSTLLRLVIEGKTVTGELAVLPFEKDKARGPIRGTLSHGQIRADWQRSGEGVTEPYEVVFTLRGDTVTWREGERVRKEGKWVLKDTAQGYVYVVTKSTCPSRRGEGD